MTTLMEAGTPAARVATDEPLHAARQIIDGLRRAAEGYGLLPQMSRYTVVSVCALALDFLLFLGLTHGGLMRPAVAGAMGYAAGLVLHFFLSVRYVFNVANSGKSHSRLFAEFVVTGVLGLLITGAVIALATDYGHLPPVVGKAAAVLVSFAVVFGLRRSFVFAKRLADNRPWVA